MKRQEKGFALVPILLIIVVISIIGLIGWKIYDNGKNKTETTATTSTTPVPSTTSQPKTTKPEDKFVLVIQDDDTIIAETPSQATKTNDQKLILEAVREFCKTQDGSPSYVVVNHVTFENTPNFKQDGNYAYLNTSCSTFVTKLDQLGGSGSAFLLHKADGKWIYDINGQMAPNCKDVDGKGYPKSISSGCYDGTDIRAPK